MESEGESIAADNNVQIAPTQRRAHDSCIWEPNRVEANRMGNHRTPRRFPPLLSLPFALP